MTEQLIDGYISLGDELLPEERRGRTPRTPREMLRTTPRRIPNIIDGHHTLWNRDRDIGKLWSTRKTSRFAWLPTRVEHFNKSGSSLVWFELYHHIIIYYVPNKKSSWKTINFKRS